MKRIALALLALVVTASAFAADTQRYLVATKQPFGAPAMQALRNSVDAVIETREVTGFRSFRGFAANLTEAEVETLRSSGEVRWIEPAVERYAFDVTRNLMGQTIPHGITATYARQAGSGRRTGVVNVVVLDTGIDFNHPELKAIYAGGYNALIPGEAPFDDNGHGTHVAGTIAAADNDAGVVGVAPNVRLWGVKLLDASGKGLSDTMITGIDWVLDKKQELGGNWVLNLSLGAMQPSDAEREAFQRAADAGVVVVAATGNFSTLKEPAPVAYPAAYPTVVAVGAVDAVKSLAYFSNQGPEVDFGAPGVRVLSTVPNGIDYLTFIHDGTKAELAREIGGSSLGTLTADYVYCGIGRPEEFPASVRGQIALIKRGGEIPFAQKARAAKAAGAIAVMIFNSDQSNNPWTLADPANPNEVHPIVVRLTLEQGEALAAKRTGRLTLSHEFDQYAEKSGTSMSSPHVAGAAALLWTIAPDATAAQIVNALRTTAVDLGTPGQDNLYGAGMISIFDAARLLAPSAFVPAPSTGRAPGRRGR
ncbi:MAG TPA: S8 family serine peptidase [Thermoanaerobaculia bacterium]|nr:S8 family serine peptidase [Thermoanaerobaculia bacterium]